jgi:hypothetical protein
MARPKTHPYYWDAGARLGIHALFPLEETQLRAVIKKKKGAPKGKLRQFYDCRNNRELITKVARDLFYSIIWDVIHGHRFYFPGTYKSYIHVDFLPDNYLKIKRQLGFYKYIDLSIWNYKLPAVRVKSAKSKRENDYMITFSGPFFSDMIKLWTAGEKIGGKKPKHLKHYLPELYERFAYIREESINFIVSTFLTNYKVAVDGGAKITFDDKVNWMLSHPIQLYQTNYDWWRAKEVKKTIKDNNAKKLEKANKEIFKDVTIS